MKKIATIDIGTNSVLYSLFEVDQDGTLNEVYFTRSFPRIGANLKSRVKPLISEKSFQELKKILKKATSHAQKHNADEIIIAATNPLRLAQNGLRIRDRLQETLGCQIQILSSKKEAELSFLGAVGRLRKNQSATIIDLGGGSTELICYRGDELVAFTSIPEGAVSLTDRFGITGPITKEQLSFFEKQLSGYKRKIRRFVSNSAGRTVLVGGTSSCLAMIKDDSIFTRQAVVSLVREELELLVTILSGQSNADRRKLCRLDQKRAEIIFAGAFWLDWLYKVMDIKKAEATSAGLRHGLARSLWVR